MAFVVDFEANHALESCKFLIKGKLLIAILSLLTPQQRKGLLQQVLQHNRLRLRSVHDGGFDIRTESIEA
jgi:hypothetical protein